jgi:hypothetical protein
MAGKNAKPTSQPPLSVDESVVKLLDDIRREFSRKLDAYGARFDTLETLLASYQAENTALKAALDEKEREITSLKRQTNDQGQYLRAWSIRILDLPIPPDEDAHDNYTVMKHVFHKVLKPIFQGAIQKNLLQSMPTFDSVLETAHILPSKPNQTPPIIARFYSRNIKSMIFKLKREFATTIPAPASQTRAGSKSRPLPAKLAHPFFEDLTTTNFLKMRAISQDKRVLACWSVAGQLRFRLHGEEQVRKVTNVFDTVEKIVSS